MKKLILLAAFIIVAGATFGQTLQKGNSICPYVMTINLDPDVTMNQFIDFLVNKAIPEWDKHFPGVKSYIAKGIRGENKNNFAVISFSESVEISNKYFNEDGTFTELGNSAWEKLQPIIEETNKFGTFTVTMLTDWVIQ